MGKVDWITWKTDPKDIINPKKIFDNMEDIFNDYNTYMNPIVYEQIKDEVINGGLREDAFIVSGEAIANIKAKEILNLIDDIKIEIESLKESVLSSSEEQKEIEKEQLIKELEDKLKIEKIYLDNANNNDSIEIRDVINDRIEKLQERLNSVSTL